MTVVRLARPRTVRLGASVAAAFLLALAPRPVLAQHVIVTIVTPVDGAGYDRGPIAVQADVQSDLAITHAVVAVDDRSAILSPSSGSWRGTVDLSGLAPGYRTFTVIATDAGGRQGVAARRVLVDDKPRLAVASPEAGTVVSGFARVRATCTDDTAPTCVLRVRVGDGAAIGPAPDAVDLAVSLAQLTNARVPICIEAEDALGQLTQACRTVLTPTPTHLAEYAQVVPGSRVLDVGADRVLFVEPAGSGQGRRLTMRSLTSGADTVIFDAPNRVPYSGGLTPRGAIFVERVPPPPFGAPTPYAVREWRDGVLLDLGVASSGALDVAGSWAAWPLANNDLRLRNLDTGTDAIVASDVFQFDVAGNGDVVFTRSNDLNVFRLRNGSVTALTSGTAFLHTAPVTDGVSVVFGREPTGVGHDVTSIVRLGDSGEDVLVPAWGTETPMPTLDYHAIDGWVAFTRPDTQGVRQPWVRSPAGVLTQVGSLASHVTFLDNGIDATGHVLFRLPPTVAGTSAVWLGGAEPALPTEIAVARFRSDRDEPGWPLQPFRVGASWRFALGASLRRLTLTAGCEYSVANSPVNVPADGQQLALPVMTAPGCLWQATTHDAWIEVGNTGVYTGSGTAILIVERNAGPSRAGTIWVAGHPVSFTPAGGLAGASDTDEDQMPDSWEASFGVNPFSDATAESATGDPDGDGRSNLQELIDGTHPRGFHTRYLAEGATGSFDTTLALFNVGAVDAHALVRFQLPHAGVASQTVTLAPLTRRTLDVEKLGGSLTAAEFSAVIESDEPLVVDRTMTWGADGYGSHAETAIAAPSQTWYLAEGATHSGFALFYLLQNPTDTEAHVEVEYLLPAGPPETRSHTVPARSRYTIWVNQEGAPLASTDVGAIIRADQPLIVERAMYRDQPGQPFAAGHESAGVTAPGTSWFLAEGATGAYFDLFVLIANPGDTDAAVTATFLLPEGAPIVKSITAPARSRTSLWVDQLDPAFADTAVSTIVESTNGVPVIVERAMWWPGPTSATWAEAHNAVGVAATGRRWALAEGESGGPRGTETYFLIANRGVADTARVTLYFEDGTTASRDVAVAAGSRTNVAVHVEFPGAASRRYAAIVEAQRSDAQIVVERAMYSNASGVTWAAGTVAVGTKLQ